MLQSKKMPVFVGPLPVSGFRIGILWDCRCGLAKLEKTVSLGEQGPEKVTIKKDSYFILQSPYGLILHFFHFHLPAFDFVPLLDDLSF